MAVFIAVFVGWIFSVCLHEFGHAIVAYYGGDTSVKEKGYLTLNPLKYTNPFLSIILPLAFLAMGGIGLPGGAVYIERRLLRSRLWESLVSLGGPAITALLMVTLSIPFWFGFGAQDDFNAAAFALAFLVWLQAFALCLNLLPVPPLDGFGILRPWLPPAWAHFARDHASAFLIGIFFVLLAVPPAQKALILVLYHIVTTLGVPYPLVGLGRENFSFWEWM